MIYISQYSMIYFNDVFKKERKKGKGKGEGEFRNESEELMYRVACV